MERLRRDRDRRYEERRERFRMRLRHLRQGEEEAVTEEELRGLGHSDDLRPQQRSSWGLASNIFCLFFASIFPDQNHHTV